MEKAKVFLHSLKPWQIFLSSGGLIVLAVATIFVTTYLRQSAKIKLGSDAGLVITADRQDSLGAFTDTKFTLKSDKDLKISDVRGSVAFIPETAFDVQEVSARQFNISPKTVLLDNSIYKIKVLSEAKTYSWAFQTKNNFRVVQTLPGDKGTFVPTNSGIEITFSHDKWEDIGFAENNFEIKPFAEGRFERHNRTLSFVPKELDPETLYTITLKKGLKLKGSSDILKDDFSFRFETRSKEGPQETTGFSRNFYEFSRGEIPAFDIYSSRTISDLKVKIFQYPSVQGFYSDYAQKLAIPEWATNTNRKKLFSTSWLSKVLEFTPSIQKESYVSYFMLPQTLEKGYYIVESSQGNITTQALFQITDLSAFLSVSGTKTLVWVNDTASGKPVEKATVSFSGKTGETGTDGVAYFDTPIGQITGEPEMITVNLGNDTLFLPPQSTGYYYYNEYRDSRRQEDKYWSYLYLDRPAYLPQDKVNLWGLLRDRDNLNNKQKFTLEITKTDYNSWDFNSMILLSKDIETSDMGTFINQIPLTNYSPGNYGISLKVNNKIILSSAFTVETYTKPAYGISINSSKEAILPGETVTLSGKATFFEGTPVAGMNLRYTGIANGGNVTTDSLGSYSFSYTPEPPTSGMDYSPEMTYINISPTNQEEGAIQSGTSFAVYDSSLVFGREKQEVSGGNARVELSLLQVDTSKYSRFLSPEETYAPASGKKITGSVVQYENIKKEIGTYYDFINKTTSPKYEYSIQTSKIADISLDTNQEGKAFYSMNLENGKSYGIEVESLDDFGRVARHRVYLYGAASENPQDNFVSLKTDKSGEKAYTYSINEKVDLTMMKGENPLVTTENSRFLYLWAQRGIKSYQVSQNNNYSFNFPEAFIPNVVIQGVHFTGKTYEVTEGLNLYFDTSSKKISLDIGSDKTSYIPGDTAKISVMTKNYLGAPVSAEVNLNLVDEAYYKMNPSLADPLSRIYNALDSDIIATYHSHQYPYNLGGAEAGGCFLSGTEILMADGTSKSIEEVITGDSIKTFFDPSSKELVAAKVTKTLTHTVLGYLLINNHLRVTGEHNLFINGRWLTAAEIRVGDEYLDNTGKYKKITSIEALSGLNNVYNLVVENQHTYLAEGFYAHNEKGRDLFADNAFFGNIKTGKDGKGSVDIKLPDNLTSWRITSQAITSDLLVGASTNPLVVKLPFFVDAIFNTEYLAADKPTIIVRTFGEDLSAGEAVSLTVQIPTLEIDKNITTKAFEPVQINLGTLKTGDHKVIISATSSKHSDKLIRSFKVIDSHLKIAKSVNVNLEANTVPAGSADSYTKLVFSDQGFGRYYPSLVNLSYTWGDRLDQKLGRSLSGELMKKYFDNSVEVDKTDFSAYLTGDNSYAIYPYAATDLTLSAYVAALASDRVDKNGLANFLYQSLSTAIDVDTASVSLFGLASLNEPVLMLVNNLWDTADLTPMSRIYLTMATALLGDTEVASQKYKSILSDFGKTSDNLTYLEIGKDKDSYLRATATVAALAGILNEPEVDSLYAYTVVNATRDILIIPEQILAIKSKLENTKPSSVSFSFTQDGKKTNKILEKGQTFTVVLSQSDLSTISFSDIKGSVGLSTFFEVPLDSTSTKIDKSIFVKRSYSVAGEATDTFSTSDLIKVSLSASMGEMSQDGCYQISDILPSGLKPVTNIYRYGLSTTDIWYPYEINGQRVSFCIGKAQVDKPINYYARVISSGEYKAESALIQSLITPSVYNFSAVGAVSIK